MNPTKSKGNQVKRRNQLFVAMLIAGITTMTVQAAWAQTDHSTHYDAAQPAVAEKQTVPPTEDHGLCRNKVERTKNVARVRKIKKLNYKTVQLWTKADLWRQVSFAFSESYAWFQYPQ